MASRQTGVAGEHIKIAAAVAKRNLWWFKDFPHIGLEDLVQEGVAAAMRAESRYDAARGCYSTWIGMAVQSRLKDCLRSARREAVRQLKVRDMVASAKKKSKKPEDSYQDSNLSGDCAHFDTLVVGTTARQLANRYVNDRRKRAFDKSSLAACLCIKLHRGWSYSALIQYMEETPDLLNIMMFRHVPSQQELSWYKNSLPRGAIKALLQATYGLLARAGEN